MSACVSVCMYIFGVCLSRSVYQFIRCGVNGGGDDDGGGGDGGGGNGRNGCGQFIDNNHSQNTTLT